MSAPRRPKAHVLPLLASLLASAGADGHDWPQFLGPTRDGVYAGAIGVSWAKQGPKTLWRKPAGTGFSAPIVAGKRVLLFDRKDNQERLTCYSHDDGSRVWRGSYPATYRDDFGFSNGPRATPCVGGDTVFTYGAAGVLTAWELATGKRRWQVDTKATFSPAKGFFGAACSPLVEGAHVLVNVGGSDGAGIVAFETTTGEVAWKATDDEASYSSPTAATIDGKRQLFFFTRSGLVALDPSGSVRFEFPFRARIHASVNAATPLVQDGRVFISASYRTGAVLLDVRETPPKTVWSSRDVLSNHYATSVFKDGFFYGFDGRQEHGPALRAVRATDGDVAWSKEGLGSGTLFVAGDHLVIVNEKGHLIVAQAAPGTYREVARATLLSGTVRAHAALAHGLLYLRSTDALLCVDVRPEKES